MNIKYFLIFGLLFLSTTSCLVTHFDVITEFRFTGNTYDLTTSKPLGDVRISFVDTGYDYVRSKKNHTLLIGRSEINGNIDHEFEYWWGYNKGWSYPDPSGSFEILLNKEGYNEKKLLFNGTDLEIHDGKVMVPLGFVYLEKV